MTNKNFLDDISDKVASLLPKAEALGSEMKGELNAKIQSAIKSSLESLDVVTREEFDAQAAMLARAEARVADLEARIEALENSKRGVFTLKGVRPLYRPNASAVNAYVGPESPTVSSIMNHEALALSMAALVSL